jgi:hypothetical protein
MQKIILTFFIATVSLNCFCQSIWVIDFAKTKDNKRQEMLYYIENNWKAYRDAALREGYIKSYLVLETIADTTNDYNFILLTEFPDSASLAKVEENFGPIMKKLSPNGPSLLNSSMPGDFRLLLPYKEAATVFSSSNKKSKNK